MTNNFTYPSLPAIAAGFNNAEIISSKFVYNFFTPDERLNENFSTFSVDGLTDQAYFASRISEIPRYVKIDFKTPNPGSSNLGLPSLTSRIAKGEKIIFETAPFNTNMSSIEIADTLVDSRVYQITSASLSFGSLPPAEVEYAYTPPSSTSLSADNPKSLIFNSLSNIQSAGYRYAKSDVREEVKTQFLKDVRAFWTSISINNMFIGDIANQVIKDQRSIFADEFAAVISSADSVQERARQSRDPFKIQADDYDYTIPTNNVVILDADTPIENLKTQYSLVGYVAQKFSQQADGTIKIYDDLVFDTGKNFIFDPNIRYGGVYSYQIRSVYNVRLYVAAQDIKGRGTGIAQVDMLFATAGSNIDVDCIELVPPKPPEDLYFKLEADGSLFIGWRFPLNKQRDIKKFQVFRRKSITMPFEIIAELDFDDSFSPFESTEGIPKELIYKKLYPSTFFIDKKFNLNSKYIYTIVSIDAHGLTSNYSAQLEVSVNLLTEALKINPVCRAGAPKPYPNLTLLQDFFPDLIKDSGHEKMTVYFNPDYTDLTDNNGNRQNLINYNSSRPTYKIHILETNLAQDQIIDISMSNDKITRKIPASQGKIYTQII